MFRFYARGKTAKFFSLFLAGLYGETENFCDQCHQFGFKVP